MEKTVESKIQETVPVTWQQHEDLGACMGELYEKSLWTDVKFHCKDHKENERIFAHKIVLAARSPVFQATFFGPCADGKEEIEFGQAESRVLDLFLRYMYTDSTDLDEDTAPSVLKVAHNYQVKKLVQLCANYLATILTTENALTIFSLSMLYQITSLRETCCSFIDKNAEEILHSEGFLDLPEEYLRYILKGDTFFAEENRIFTTSEEWAERKLRQGNLEKNGTNIRKALGETFFYMRLPTMTFETLTNCIRRKGYFSVDEYEDIIEFINEVPGLSVQSNSCVRRIPTEETLRLIRENDNTITRDKISTTFQISVTRDLKLSYFTLATVQQFLKYDEMYCKNNTSAYTSLSQPYSRPPQTPMQVFGNSAMGPWGGPPKLRQPSLLSGYTGKAIKVESSDNISVSDCISVLEKVCIETLSNELDVAISGHFEITCTRQNNEKKPNITQEYGDAKNKSGEDEDPSVHSAAANNARSTDDEVDDEAVDDTKLILEQDFELLSSKISERIIELKEHVILTKVASPYTFNLTMQYSRRGLNMEMKTKCSSANGTITSEYGQLKVKDITGGFAGIKNLHFENISGRETV